MSAEIFFPKIEWLAEPANRDGTLRRIGRHCRAEVLLMAGETGAYLVVADGEIIRVDSGPSHLRSVSFAISAPLDCWTEFWRQTPRPGYHDIFAMARFGHAVINGDLGQLLEHLPYFKRLLWLPRRLADG